MAAKPRPLLPPLLPPPWLPWLLAIRASSCARPSEQGRSVGGEPKCPQVVTVSAEAPPETVFQRSCMDRCSRRLRGRTLHGDCDAGARLSRQLGIRVSHRPSDPFHVHEPERIDRVV